MSKIKFHLEQRDWNFEQPKEYKLIPLTKGKFTKVDNEDFDRLKGINWSYSKDGYAVSGIYGRLHRYIMNSSKSFEIDHENGDGLDNRKSNLRKATHKENMFNTKPQKGTSKFKGVSWNKLNNKWSAQIKFNYKKIHIGLYYSEYEASVARDIKALKLQGEFAYLNHPDKKEEYLKIILGS